MFVYKTGDILTEEAEALVNTVNCVGVMGRGIALQYKKAFPANFKAYEAACKREEVQPGSMFVFETGQLTNPRLIVNFPTKRHWRGKSRLDDIEVGLAALVDVIKDHSIRSVAIPPLGCGLGGLAWADVRPRIEAALGALAGVEVILFEPGNAPVDGRLNRSSKVPKMTPGRAALVGLMDRYIRGLLDPFITLLEVHKLMYFLQAAGEPLKLKYVKAHYGPYAENLRHVLNAVEGHFLSGYASGGDGPAKRLELVPGALDDAQAFLRGSAETQARLDQVSELVEGFESAFGMELLSTVHWVVEEGATSDSDVVQKVFAWGERKQQFTERQVLLALDTLVGHGWCNLSSA